MSLFNWHWKGIEELFGRSSQWRSVRANHLREHPECEACGSKKDLEVHHVEPYYKNPDRECDPTNLLTLCGGTRNCHWSVGHGYDWRSWRPDAQKLAEVMKATKVVK